MKRILAIDQGTTSTRAFLFSEHGEVLSHHSVLLTQSFPHPAWVEHDPEEIWASVLNCIKITLEKANCSPSDVLAIGICNQRETTVLWNKISGEPVYPAIVWQDRRTAELCEQLSKKLNSKKLQEKTGLLFDPYFSATKIKWILDHVDGAKQLADKNQLAFGTIDSFLLWRLTGGKKHLTDASNASRTLLFNIQQQTWDKELLELFQIPKNILPKVMDNATLFGETDPQWFGTAIPITGMAGDQQAASIGQALFKPGMIKSTYGTGCFMLMNTGENALLSENQLLSTILFRLNNKVCYGLEGSIFSAGTTIQWLRDKLNFFKNSSETAAIAASIEDTDGVYLVPAFTGLGAPYWNPEARAIISGITRNTGIPELVRAGLESVCYQTNDLIKAMNQDLKSNITHIRVDGGMAANDWLLQFLADILNIEVERPQQIETGAWGAALLAGLGAGLYTSLSEISKRWALEKQFTAKINPEKRESLYQGWQRAIKRV